ncbi:MAG: thioesterase domain-containing protein [Myxococcales bacterium]
MEEDDIVVEIRGGTRTPFWLLHPNGGNVLYAHVFASALSSEQPLLGIQARGLNGRSAPFLSVVEAARFYLEQLRRRQPRGPYFLGGPSFGGNIAYEMACSLVSEGETVALLALFDTFGPDYPRRAPLWARTKTQVTRVVKQALGVSTERHVIRPDRSKDAIWAMARIPAGHSDSLKALQRVSLAHEHALRTYRPSRYPGRVDLFRAATPPEWKGVSFEDQTNGWGAVVDGGVRVTTVPGTHQFILDPPWVEHLVSAFSTLLQEATADTPARSLPAHFHPSSQGR